MTIDGDLELLTRGAAFAAFACLAALCLRARTRGARVFGALFFLGAGAHALTQSSAASIAIGPAIYPLSALSAAEAAFFWAFALELFEDEHRFDARRLAPAALLLAIIIGAELSSGDRRLLLVGHNLVSAGLIGHALLAVARGWRGDLVAARRRLRAPMLAIAAAYAFAVISVQIGELFLGPADALSPLAAGALAALGLVSVGAFARLEPDLFAAPERAAPVVDEPAALGREDAALAAALERLMGQERIYRDEGLTITALAARLGAPEHHMRRLINHRLGHRNFSAFLNEARLADVIGALLDPAQDGVPISTLALDAGFGSLGPFNRAFKARTGLTPSAYRAARGAGDATA